MAVYLFQLPQLVSESRRHLPAGGAIARPLTCPYLTFSLQCSGAPEPVQICDSRYTSIAVSEKSRCFSAALKSETAWAGETEAAENEIFNITNGDYFRWQFMWPRLARMFEMDIAEPVPMPLAVYMADKAALWAEMTQKYHLLPTLYEQPVAWRFGDFICGSAFDNITSTIKARRAGFHDCIDTEEMFSRLFEDLRQTVLVIINHLFSFLAHERFHGRTPAKHLPRP